MSCDCDVLKIVTVDADEVVKIVEQGPQGPAGANGQGVPTGGSALQVLRKKSNADYDTEWATGGGGGVTSWNDLEDKPSTFTPSAHTHTSDDITDFTEAVEAVSPPADWNTLANKPTIPSSSSATPQSLGIAAAGTSSDFSRADHVHAIPTAADVGLGDSDDVSFNTVYSNGLTLNGDGLGLMFTEPNAGEGAIATSRDALGLGTAATADIGTGAGDVAEGDHTHTSFPSLRIDPATGNVGSLVVGQTTSGQTDWVTIDTLVRLKSSSNSFKASLGASALSADRAISLPDKAGTLALTSDFAAPSAIGSTTPNSGAFTTLSASTSLTLGTSGILSGGTNTIEQRNTTSAQTFRIYNTVSGTADANYERGFMRWSSNVLQIGTEAAGTGTVRNLEFTVSPRAAGYNSNTTWLTMSDAASGPRFALYSHGGVLLRDSGYWGWNTSASLVSGSTGDLRMYRSGAGILRLQSDTSDFNRIQLGGTTTSFPALKRDTTKLQARLADDSDFTAIQGKLTTETAYTAGAPTATGYLVLYDSNGTAYKVPAEAL